MPLKKILNIIISFILFFDLLLAQESQFQLDGAVSTNKENLIDKDNYIKVSLTDVVLETVAQSYNVKAAREKVIQAKIKVDDAYAGYLPSIDGTYKTAKTEKKPGDENAEKKYYGDRSYKLSIRENLYAGGATSSEIKSLNKKYEVAKNDYRIVIAKEIQNAIKAYFDVLFNFNSLTVNTENMDRLNEILDIVNVKYDSGATSIGDLSSIKANVSNAKSKLIKIQSKFNEALGYYKYIVGDNFENTFPYEEKFDTTVDDFDSIVQKALENNIKIQTFKLDIAAQKYKLLKSKSGFKPKLDLEVSAETITDQEDFTNVEKNYKAQLVLSYNFYNKGRDKNKILTANSMIRGLKYNLKEEIRKLQWTLSKLHRSILSVTNASVSTKAEVLASKEMVNAYWDGFKLGEQDLQVLLQGQRQLNSAQLDLIKNKKTAITDYFKLLSNTGDLLSYFKLDINQDNFIDFTRGIYKNLLKTPSDDKLTKDLELAKNKDQNLSTAIDTNTTKVVDTNTTLKSDSNKTIIDNNGTINTDINTTGSKDKLNQLLDFENKFLESDDDKWTLRLYYFDKVYQALDFANEHTMANNIFVFDTLDKNKIKTNIAYNIFDTKQSAQKSLDDLNITNINKKVLSIKDIKGIYYNFKNKKLQTKQKIKKVKPFQTNPKFKKRFLNAQANFYTINITSFASMKDAQELLKKEKIYNNSFVFKYGEEKDLVKVVYGIFENYDDAAITLNSMKNIKQKYEPVIEPIANKQSLFRQYNQDVVKKIIIDNNDTLENKTDTKAKIEKEIQVKEVKKKTETTKDFNTSRYSDFGAKFINAPRDYYTLNLATLFDAQSADKFYTANSSKIDIFIVKFGQDRLLYKAMGGVYETLTKAQEALKKLSSSLKRNKPRIEKIGIKQDLYKKYYDKYYSKQNDIVVEKNTTIVEDLNKTIQKVEKKEVLKDTITAIPDTNVTNDLSVEKIYIEKNSTVVEDLNKTIKPIKTVEQNTTVEKGKEVAKLKLTGFKDRFLNAPKNYYTLNIATLYSQKEAQRFDRINSDMIDLFIFKFGQDKTMYKAMSGIYKTIDDAQNAIEKLPQYLKINKPRIEKIEIKQNLYFKYNTKEN